MSNQLQDTTFHKSSQLAPGEIKVIDLDGVFLFRAMNIEHHTVVDIGVLIGATYEKKSRILMKPERSFCLPVAELEAAEQLGAKYLCFIPRGEHGHYAISVETFRKYAEPFFHSGYGRQLRCSLRFFQYSSAERKRTATLDNPVIPINEPLTVETAKPQKKFGWQNLDLFSR